MDRVAHWDSIYAAKGATQVSWYQQEPRMSLELIDALDLPLDAAIVDAGGGASTLVDTLLRAGYQDLTVLDVSGAALTAAQERLGPDALKVTWLQEDLLRWKPSCRYDLWHDRAVFHFLTAAADRDLYRRVLGRALRANGRVVIGTFAQEGPVQCSGLEVRRYPPEGIWDELGGTFDLIGTRREEHLTPAGVSQAFSWALMRRRAGEPPRQGEEWRTSPAVSAARGRS